MEIYWFILATIGMTVAYERVTKVVRTLERQALATERVAETLDYIFFSDEPGDPSDATRVIELLEQIAGTHEKRPRRKKA